MTAQYRSFLFTEDWVLRVGIERFGRIISGEEAIPRMAGRTLWGAFTGREERMAWVFDVRPYAIDAKGFVRQDLREIDEYARLGLAKDALPDHMQMDLQAVRWDRMRKTPPQADELLTRLRPRASLLRAG